MQFLIFILVYPFIWLFSILPFSVLYFISDGIYYILYYIIGYRKEIVRHNLKLAFPEKSNQELTIISKKFYRHFIDIFIEMIKSFTISEKEIVKRFKFTNIEILDNLVSKNRSLILLGSHYANWEWIFNLNLFLKQVNGYAVYKKLKNPFFNKTARESRERYNTTLITTKAITELIAHNTKNNIQSIYGFLSDQSPKSKKAHHWSTFLGRKVPVITGSEMLAKKHNLAVVSFTVKKIKRGFYEATFNLLAENPNDYKDYEITDSYLKELEQVIYKQPEFYFWTHKRFKHVKSDE